MCGRYYVDDETAREIEKLVRGLNQELRQEGTQRKGLPPAGKREAGKQDICPSQKALVLEGEGARLGVEEMAWGFPGFQGKGLLINARAEGVLEKRTFRDSILHRRCVIPARGFYEWNPKKEKFTFTREDQDPLLLLAGCFKEIQGENHFVILTTEANLSVAAVHERMPLVLEKKEVEDWVFDDRATEFLLHKKPVLLKKGTEYEQMELLFPGRFR